MKILIAGLAKTGTTALFHLLRTSLPGRAVLVFEPNTCPSADALAAAPNVLAKIILGNPVDTGSFAGFDRTIVLVRDPRDRIVSAVLYSWYEARHAGDPLRVRQVLEVLQRKERDPQGVPLCEVWETMRRVDGSAARRDAFAAGIVEEAEAFDAYLRETPDALRYKYEDFVERRYGELECFLGLPMTGAAEVPQSTSRVVRTRSHGDWRNWMTREDVAFFRPVVEPMLSAHGYDANDWNTNADPVIAPAHCSEYIARLAADARRRDFPLRGFA